MHTHFQMLEVVLFLFTACIISAANDFNKAAQILYAVNVGGDSFTDSHGIDYIADPLKGDENSVESDYGKMFSNVYRVSPQDAYLYQSERYSLQDFSYSIPHHLFSSSSLTSYVLVLKFSEVYFKIPDQKVFNVLLNDEVKVVDHLDIFAKVGLGTAHDEYVSFSVDQDSLLTMAGDAGEHFTLSTDLKITFQKIDGKDNPKVCAFYLLKGNINDVPKLQDKKLDYSSYFNDDNEFLAGDEVDVPSPSSNEDFFEDDVQEISPSTSDEVDLGAQETSPFSESSDPYQEGGGTNFVYIITFTLLALIPVVFLLYKI